ncbi:MAG: peptidoglycan editing factor PgeF [Campylobacterales bacterium]|nr:peptidoglycan editing factor PgeF [Campylobacterales bacterium]
MKDLLIKFTTKADGNIAFHVGDNKSNVIKNHEKLARKLNYDVNSLVWMKQIHGNDVVTVDENIDFQNPPTCDSLITNIKNKPLMVMVADCTPILFYDEKQKAIGAIHAGRAGAFLNIVKETALKMAKTYGTKIEDLKVHLGTSIKNCCYQVNEEIEKEANSLGYGFSISKTGNGIFLDVNKILNKQLKDLGITDIEESGSCSSCESDSLFSYRKDKEKQGRMAGVIMMK